ncbi:MAG: baseplate J/gp47 family protein, partial [Chloroflexota bacterium]
TEVHVVARSEAGLFAAGAPAKPEVEPLWSPWQREAPALYLDGPYENAPQEGYAVLHQPGMQVKPLLATISRAFMAESGDAEKPMTVTVLSLEADDDPGHLDRQSSVVRFAAEPLPLYDDKPVAGQELIFDNYVPDLFAGQRLIISGRRMRARFTGQDQTFQLFSADGLVAKDVPAHEPLLILDIVSDPDRDPITHQPSWRLQSRSGVTGYAPAGTPLIMAPAKEDDPIISEVVVIRLVDNKQPRTRIVLEEPLRHIYDRAGLRLRANVVHATHGRTVVNEVLGNSDGSVANLKLKLRQGPLTYTSSEDGLQSSLAVTINGVTWHEAQYLTGLPRDERAYMVRQDEDENSRVIFGDGRQGARPPSTREEVRGTYRIGSGPQGNVSAGSLSLPQRVPHGIDGVTNPLPASGGTPPETIDQARRSIPRHTRALARIISLDDYIDFARTFAGIGKVQSELFSQPQGDLLHLTVCDAGGAPLPEDSDLLRNLRRAIERQRIAAVPEVQVASYEPLYFQVAATITIDPDYRPHLPQMAVEIEAALIEYFAFERRDFGQSVTAAEILAVVQPLSGVIGLRLDALTIVEPGAQPGDAVPPSAATASRTAASGTTVSKTTKLAARRAILKDGRVLPAQLLQLNRQATDWLALRWEDAT